MLSLLPRCIVLLTICSLPGWAATCFSQSLVQYELLGATGCQIGNLAVNNFAYSQLSGTVIIPDSSITVTPSLGPDTLALTFTSPDFALSGTNSAVYLLSYTWDPGDIRSLEDILNANSPVSPGFAKVTTVDCEDAAFSGAICSTSTDTIVVSDDGVTLVSPASVSFSPTVGTLGIRNTIELDGNGASSEIAGFENLLTVPEPSTLVPCLLLAALVWRRRLQRS